MAGIAFFDFDGTITKSDSFRAFLRFYMGDKEFIKVISRNIHILLMYKMGIFFNNQMAKEKIVGDSFSGLRLDEFDKACKDFLPTLESICKKSALERVEYHKKNNDKVVVVSASLEEYLKYICDKLEVDLIGTRLEVVGGIITGKFCTKNCYGIEKVNRITKLYNLSDFERIYAYGDTAGDTEMLNIANEKRRFYRYFT